MRIRNWVLKLVAILVVLVSGALSMGTPQPTLASSSPPFCVALSGAWDGIDTCELGIGSTTSLDNFSSLEIGGVYVLVNYGTITNWNETINNNGTINNYGTINNNGPAYINNNGTINNYGTINIYGFINNYGTINNYVSGTIISYRTINNYVSGTINNYGTITNNSVIIGGVINNYCGGIINGSTTPTSPVIEHCASDTTPPVVTPPDDQVVEATGYSGAVVTYTNATATDDVGVTDGPTCSPTSGSTFPLGATTVTCTAGDAADNVGSASFTVTVQDTTAPVVTLIGDATVTLIAGETYGELGATATDTVDGTFPATPGGDTVDTSTAGTYIVTYNAVDAAGNAATEVTRTVIVQSPADAISELTGNVEALVTAEVLKTGQGNGLIKPLDNAITSLEKGNIEDACNQLQDFIDKVEEKRDLLGDNEADSLVSGAKTIRNAIGCA